MSQSFNRHRRLRTSKAMREMVKETRLHPSDFIYPIFVVEGLEGKKLFRQCLMFTMYH